jgi:hypothetical protein
VVVIGGHEGIIEHVPVHPHWPGFIGSPPHDWGSVQVPQLSVPLHPSPAGPQLMPCCWQVMGEHASGLVPLPQTLC